MRIDQTQDGSRTNVELYEPAIVLIFALESEPKAIWPRDPADLARILGDLDEPARELVLHWLDVELPS